MEAVANLKKSPALKPRQVQVTGKVTRTRRYDKFTYTTIICPAADEYSKPQIVEVRSDRKFGERDEVVNIVAVLGGFEGKAYRVTDKDTGEVTSVVPVQHYLDFVEAL